MFKKIANRIAIMYHRSSIRYTVFISFTLSALVVVVLTGATFYMRFSEQLEATRQGENQILVEQANSALSAHLRNMIRLSDTVSYQVIKNADINSSAVHDQLQLFYDANSNNIRNIALFSAEGEALVTAPPAIVKEGVDVADEAWFAQALERSENLHFSTPSVQNLFRDTEGQYSWTISLSCAAEITQGRTAQQGVLLVDLRYNAIAELLRNVSLPGGGYVFLIDSDGEIIYHPRQQLLATGLATECNQQLAGYRDGEYVIEFEGEKRSVIVRGVGYTGWALVGVIPQRGLTMSSMQNMLFLLTIVFAYFAIIILINSFISGKLTVPIKKLEESVQRTEANLSGAEIYIGGPQEIEHLGKSIAQMVDELKKLTDDVIKEQAQKQKSELNALQAQINPHFLYNTLDIIVWMIEKGQHDDALKIVSALGRFFRLSLSGGKNVITVHDELEHVHNYLMIQQMRYKNKFNYTIDAKRETLELSTIKLVLQPIVENAIYHSMDYMVDGEGEIDIRAYLEGGDLYLSVRDNGLGIEPEKLSRLLSASPPKPKGSGIGLKNVHERIALYFGEGYGLTIESESDEGTLITLRLPAIPYDSAEES